MKGQTLCLINAVALILGMLVGNFYGHDSVYIASMGLGVFIFIATSILIDEINPK